MNYSSSAFSMHVGATSLLTRLLRNSVKCCDKTVAECYGRWEWFMNDAQYGNSN